MDKCNQVGCELPATHEYVWPTTGEKKCSCGEHTKAAQNILRVLGIQGECPVECHEEGEG